MSPGLRGVNPLCLVGVPPLCCDDQKRYLPFFVIFCFKGISTGLRCSGSLVFRSQWVFLCRMLECLLLRMAKKCVVPSAANSSRKLSDVPPLILAGSTPAKKPTKFSEV